jgi:hypothetical protein
MSNIKSKIQSIKDYFAERARVRRIKAGARTLIDLEMMEAAVHAYIREMEQKVRTQAFVIRTQARQLRDDEFARIDREIDLKETARWKSRHEAVA